MLAGMYLAAVMLTSAVNCPGDVQCTEPAGPTRYSLVVTTRVAHWVVSGLLTNTLYDKSLPRMYTPSSAVVPVAATQLARDGDEKLTHPF